MSIIEAIDDIKLKYDKYLEGKIKNYPRNQFVASNISECDRQMVYGVLNWQDKKPFNIQAFGNMDRGNLHEKHSLLSFSMAGIEIIESQSPFEIKDKDSNVLCRGQIDCKVKFEDKKYPAEIKSLNLNTYKNINSTDDFLRKHYHRKYLNQIQLYLYGNNIEEGMFILEDGSFHYKMLPVYIDYGICELLLKRLENNWNYVKNKEYPDRINYDDNVCRDCDFNHICLPDIVSQSAKLIDDAELLIKLNRRKEIIPISKEYELLDTEIKDYAKSQLEKEIVVGTAYILQKKTSITKRVDTKSIPEDIKKQYEVETETIRVNIIPLDKKEQIK